MIVLGAGGHATEVVELLLRLGYGTSQIWLADTRESVTDKPVTVNGFPVSHSLRSFSSGDAFVVGTGNPLLRKKLLAEGLAAGLKPHTLIGASTLVAQNGVILEEAVLVMEMGYLGPAVHIGKGTLLNTGAQVHHDSRVGEFCEICPGVHISGNCNIGNEVLIGTGAVVLPGIHIGNGAKIGAGAVVTENIPAGATAVGIPAKIKSLG